MAKELRDDWILVAERAFETGKNANVTFVVNGREIKANRARIEEHSDVFKEVFASEFDKTGGRFEMKETSFKVFKKLIMACHVPSIELDYCIDAHELFKLAHYYKIGHVSKYSE